MAPYSKRTFATTLAAVAALLLLQPECAQSSPIRNARRDDSQATVSLLASGGGQDLSTDVTSPPSLLIGANAPTLQQQPSDDALPSLDPSDIDTMATAAANMSASVGAFLNSVDLTIWENIFHHDAGLITTISIDPNDFSSYSLGDSYIMCERAFNSDLGWAPDEYDPNGVQTSRFAHAMVAADHVAVSSSADYTCPSSFVPLLTNIVIGVSFKIVLPNGHYWVGRAVNPTVGAPYFSYVCDQDPKQGLVLWNTVSLAENQASGSITCAGGSLLFNRYADNPATHHKVMRVSFGY